jgi:hypothetical protein
MNTSSFCYTPTLLATTPFSSEYAVPIFWLTGIWKTLNPFFQNAIVSIGVIQFMTSLLGIIIFVRYNQIQTDLFSDSHNNNNNNDNNNSLMHIIADGLQWVWQLWLSLLFISAPFTDFSGLLMSFIYFHSLAETTLFVLRLVFLTQTTKTQLVYCILGCYILIISMLFMMTDGVIVKGILTSPAAVVSDIGNVVTTSMIVRRYRHSFFNISHFLFASMHLVIFYIQIITACFIPYWITALIILATTVINLIWLLAYLGVKIESYREFVHHENNNQQNNLVV